MFPFHHQHRPRVMSDSPKPPIIPPQPQFQSTDSLFVSLKTPPPPPRRYQLVPIQNESNSHRTASGAFTSFGKMGTNGAFDSSRSDYENTIAIRGDFDRMPVIVDAIPKNMGDKRRKPYYYNDLNMPANDLMQLNSYADGRETNVSTEEHDKRANGDSNAVATADDDDDTELARNTMFNANLVSCGSGDSLDNVV